jgi:uncharacterized protein (UPF0332 family)
MTDEQATYLKSAWESIRDGEVLLQHNRRTGRAASCAYYAMFYAATAVMLSAGPPLKKHSALIAAFGRDFANTGKIDRKLHRYLREAEEKRSIGDYRITIEISAEDAAEQLEHAKEFVAGCETYLAKSQT